MRRSSQAVLSAFTIFLKFSRALAHDGPHTCPPRSTITMTNTATLRGRGGGGDKAVTAPTPIYGAKDTESLNAYKGEGSFNAYVDKDPPNPPEDTTTVTVTNLKTIFITKEPNLGDIAPGEATKTGYEGDTSSPVPTGSIDSDLDKSLHANSEEESPPEANTKDNANGELVSESNPSESAIADGPAISASGDDASMHNAGSPLVSTPSPEMLAPDRPPSGDDASAKIMTVTFDDDGSPAAGDSGGLDVPVATLRSAHPLNMTPLAKASTTSEGEEASAAKIGTPTAGNEKPGREHAMHVDLPANDSFPSVQASPPVHISPPNEASPAPEPPATATLRTKSASEDSAIATQTLAPPATTASSTSTGSSSLDVRASPAPPMASASPFGPNKWPTDIGTNPVTFPCKLTVFKGSVGQPADTCTKLFDELGNCQFDKQRTEFKANPLARVSLPKTLWDQYGAGLPNKYDNPLCGQILTIESSSGKAVQVIVADHMGEENFDTCEGSWNALGYGAPGLEEATCSFDT